MDECMEALISGLAALIIGLLLDTSFNKLFTTAGWSSENAASAFFLVVVQILWAAVVFAVVKASPFGAFTGWRFFIPIFFGSQKFFRDNVFAVNDAIVVCRPKTMKRACL